MPPVDRLAAVLLEIHSCERELELVSVELPASLGARSADLAELIHEARSRTFGDVI